MPDPGHELPGSTLSSADQAKGRRTLLGISTFYLGVALMGFAIFEPFRWMGGLAVIVGAVLFQSRPQGTGRMLTPRNIRRIARIAGVPEIGATVVVCGCLIAGLAGALAVLATAI